LDAANISPSQRVFSTLNGLRGTAAIGIVFYHAGGRSDMPFLLPRGYLSVDLFFVLSGFVLAHAYTGRLQTWLGGGAFIIQRLIRLLPILLPGAVIGALIELGRPNIGSITERGVEIGFLSLLGTTAVPWPFSTPLEQTIFPINGPVWSLFFEILANVIFIFVVKSRAMRAWALVLMTVGGAGIVASTIAFGTMDVGAGLYNWPGGLPRVLFSFFAGVLLYQWHIRAPGPRVPRGLVWFYPVILILLLMTPRFGTAVDYELDLVCVGLVFPLMIRLAASSEPLGGQSRVFEIAGMLSYPLYAVHYPIIRAVCFVLLRHPIPILARFGVVCASTAGLLFLSWALLRYYDEPVRRFFMRRLRPPGVNATTVQRVKFNTL
jgi:peptidoglycan/LPS O-acetylase OafA/YrhL